jgi:uncharacterized protein
MARMDHSLTNFAPINREERIAELDVIRGFALLGILIVNMQLFSYPSLYINMLDGQWWAGAGDRVVKQGIYILIEYKFISMFSFLFGIGFMIFLEQARQKGRNGVRLYMRRLSVLMVIGLIHSYLIWFGDILLVYAVLGFLLLFFHNSMPRTLLNWALCILLLPALWIALHTFAPSIVPLGPPLGPTTETIDLFIQSSLEAYSNGTYAQLFQQRLLDISMVQESGITVIPLTFAMFLIGAYVWKREWFKHKTTDIAFLRKVWWQSGLIGVVFLVIQLVIYERVDLAQSGFNYALYAGALISGPALCFFYISSILLLLRRSFWRKLFSPLQDVGRMALTHYLLQSMICTTLFYSYGLGLYGHVGPLLGILLSFLIYFVQIVLSRLWMRRFKYGPVEWLWRSLTYGTWQSID